MEKALETAIRDAVALLDEHGFESYPQRHALKAALEQPAQDEPSSKAREDMTQPCPFCAAEPYHLCGHVNSDYHEQPAQQEFPEWVERWYGSGPERGWWVICGRDHIAHLGPSEFAEEAVSKIVTAHNQTRPQAREPLTEGEILQLAIDADDLGTGHIGFARAIEAKLKERNA